MAVLPCTVRVKCVRCECIRARDPKPLPGKCSESTTGEQRPLAVRYRCLVRCCSAVSVDNNNNSTTLSGYTRCLVCVCASVTHSRTVCSGVAVGSLFPPCSFADVQQGVVRTRRCGNRILAKCVLAVLANAHSVSHIHRYTRLHRATLYAVGPSVCVCACVYGCIANTCVRARVCECECCL